MHQISSELLKTAKFFNHIFTHRISPRLSFLAFDLNFFSSGLRGGGGQNGGGGAAEELQSFTIKIFLNVKSQPYRAFSLGLLFSFLNCLLLCQFAKGRRGEGEKEREEGCAPPCGSERHWFHQALRPSTMNQNSATCFHSLLTPAAFWHLGEEPDGPHVNVACQVWDWGFSLPSVASVSLSEGSQARSTPPVRSPSNGQIFLAPLPC